MREFREAFKQLLRSLVDTTEESITYLTVESEDQILSQEEIDIAIKVFKNNKTSGKNSIMTGLLKND